MNDRTATGDAERRHLLHMIASADELAGYVAGVTRDEFNSDRMLQRAVEQVLANIGEAAKSLTDRTRDRIDQPWKEIIRFRDKGIHAYDSLSPPTLYRIATESVPRLRDAVRTFLREHP